MRNGLKFLIILILVVLAVQSCERRRPSRVPETEDNSSTAESKHNNPVDEGEHDFRNVNWGWTMEQVEATEGNSLNAKGFYEKHIYPIESIRYKEVELAGMPNWHLEYRFAGNQLYMAEYSYLTHNPNYNEPYKKIKDILIQKYRDSFGKEEGSGTDSSGQGEKRYVILKWGLEDKTIILKKEVITYGMEVNMIVYVSYISKEYEKRVEELRNEKNDTDL